MEHMFVLVCLSGLGQVQGAVERRPGQINSPSFANESEWTTAVSIAFYASRYHRSLENIYMHISKKKKEAEDRGKLFSSLRAQTTDMCGLNYVFIILSYIRWKIRAHLDGRLRIRW